MFNQNDSDSLQKLSKSVNKFLKVFLLEDIFVFSTQRKMNCQLENSHVFTTAIYTKYDIRPVQSISDRLRHCCNDSSRNAKRKFDSDSSDNQFYCRISAPEKTFNTYKFQFQKKYFMCTETQFLERWKDSMRNELFVDFSRLREEKPESFNYTLDAEQPNCGGFRLDQPSQNLYLRGETINYFKYNKSNQNRAFLYI